MRLPDTLGPTRVAVVGLALLVTGCGGDGDAEPIADTPATSAPTATPGPSTAAETLPAPVPAPSTTEPEVELPTGILFAVPTQNREDPAKNQFQVQVHNGTRERYDIAGVQFRWAGYSTIMAERDSIVVGGQIIDFPVPFAGAECVGDGSVESMPNVDEALVILVLADGSELEVPVVDQWHLARKLYLEDCERQMIESLIGIEWADLHAENFEGRPVTAGRLRLTRRAGTGTISVQSVSNTIPFEFAAVDTVAGEAVAVLPDGVSQVEVPVRFLESRCDPHALAEVKQPTKFVAQVQLGDGSLHPYIIYPERSYWNEMRLTADEACVILGEVVFVGDE